MAFISFGVVSSLATSSRTLSLIWDSLSERSPLDLIAKAFSRSLTAIFSIFEIKALSVSCAVQSHGSLAASLANSFIILITGCIALCPSRTASSIIFSGNSFASDSTIRTAVSLPATTRSSSLFSSCVFVGLITYFSSTYPTLDAPTGP